MFLLMRCMFVLAVFAGAAAAGAAPIPVRDPALKELSLFQLILRTREARLAGDKANWFRFGTEVVARAPEQPDFLFSYARAAAANGKTELALAMLEQGLARGASYDVMASPEFAALRDDAKFKRLAQIDAQNAKPVARAQTFAVINDRTFGPEGITYDAARSRFIIGSIRGEIWQVDRAGVASPFVQPKDGSLFPVLGLKVDAGRKLLFAVNTIFPDFPPAPSPKAEIGVSALNVYDLEGSALRKRYLLDERPTLHGFNDVVVSNSGDAFVTDSTAGAIYKIDAASGTLAPFVIDRELTMPNGLALSHDERLLYVAHIEGISVIDLASRKRTLLAISGAMAVSSIDGLAAAGRSLFGVQPSPYLQRAIRIDLDETGLAARRLTVLDARSHPRLQQATGVIVGDAFFTVGHPNVAWLPDAGKRPDDLPTILRIPIAD